MWLLRKMAWPISILYGVAVLTRNLLYDQHILKSKKYNIPILCVGNLSVGGTGKTPMIEFLISRLKDQKKLAVLSRGYKRHSKGFQLGTSQSTATQMGDEPFQILRKFPDIAVAVDANRQNGILNLQKRIDPELILLDDAYQHRKVTPTFSILLTTYSDPFYKDWYLPTGNLRDAKSASKRADCIVVTKCPKNLENSEMEVLRKNLRKSSHQIVVFSTLVYKEFLQGTNARKKLSDLENESFTLVTGIANPQPLVDYLNEKNLRFDHLKFPDHHEFQQHELKKLREKRNILTTEKDYVRLYDKIEGLHYITVEHKFLENGESELLEAIAQKID